MGFSRQEDWCGLPFPIPEGSSWPRDQTHVSCISFIGRQILYHWATWEAPLKDNFYTYHSSLHGFRYMGVWERILLFLLVRGLSLLGPESRAFEWSSILLVLGESEHCLSSGICPLLWSWLLRGAMWVAFTLMLVNSGAVMNTELSEHCVSSASTRPFGTGQWVKLILLVANENPLLSGNSGCHCPLCLTDENARLLNSKNKCLRAHPEGCG